MEYIAPATDTEVVDTVVEEVIDTVVEEVVDTVVEEETDTVAEEEETSTESVSYSFRHFVKSDINCQR